MRKRVVLDEVREIGTGQSMRNFVGEVKESGLSFKNNGKPLGD